MMKHSFLMFIPKIKLGYIYDKRRQKYFRKYWGNSQAKAENGSNKKLYEKFKTNVAEVKKES